MPFELTVCTPGLISDMRLKEASSEERCYDWLDKAVVVDRINRVAILPEEYCHGDYPNRSFIFLYDGELVCASQWIGWTKADSEITIEFKAHTEDERCRELAAHFESAISLIKDPNLPLPVNWIKTRRP